MSNAKPVTRQEVEDRITKSQTPLFNEELNKAVNLINNQLKQLTSSEDFVDFSFTRHGIDHRILESLTLVFQEAGWNTVPYHQANRETGLILTWPKAS